MRIKELCDGIRSEDNLPGRYTCEYDGCLEIITIKNCGDVTLFLKDGLAIKPGHYIEFSSKDIRSMKE